MSLEPEIQASDDAAQDRVTTLARDLGDALAALPEYEQFLAAKERVEADDEAQERIQEFERIREEYITARETSQATHEDLRTLQNAQERLHELPIMSEYLEAQNALELRLQAVNEEISDGLAVDFGQKAGGCCHD